MRQLATAERVRALMRGIGARSRGPGRVYLTGGASAVLEGWRQSTVDVDLTLDPEPAHVFEALAKLKDELDINIELAAPSHFVPELPGWRDRSRFVARHGSVEFYHYDFYAQALAKLERAHERDLADVEQMVTRGLVAPARLLELFRTMEPGLIRYPAIDASSFGRAVEAFVSRCQRR